MTTTNKPGHEEHPSGENAPQPEEAWTGGTQAEWEAAGHTLEGGHYGIFDEEAWNAGLIEAAGLTLEGGRYSMFDEEAWDDESSRNEVTLELIDGLLRRAERLPASPGVELQLRLHEIRRHVPSGEAHPSAPRLIGQAWRQAVALPLHDVLREMAPKAQTPSDVLPVPRQTAQEAAILLEIERLELDPTALPKSTPGKPGVKAQIRDAAAQRHPHLFQGGTFDKAWDRLRKDGRLGESEGSPNLG